MRKKRVFSHISQQSTLPPHIRIGKMSLEIDMKAISKRYEILNSTFETEEENCLRRSYLLYPLLQVMFFLQTQVLDFIVDFEDWISGLKYYFGE